MKTQTGNFIVALGFAIGALPLAMAAPPAHEAIIKACDEAESAAQCERTLEAAQLKVFPGVASRDGKALRLPTRPGAPAVELRDAGDPENEVGADYRAHAFWDYWPQSRMAVVSVTARDTDYYLVVQLDAGTQIRLPAEPLLAPDNQRFVVGDFCERGCGNQVQVWRIERDRAVRERTFKPRERWYETDVSWRDATTLAAEYSVAAPRRRLAEPGELTLNRAPPMTLKLSDSGWVSDEPRR